MIQIYDTDIAIFIQGSGPGFWSRVPVQGSGSRVLCPPQPHSDPLNNSPLLSHYLHWPRWRMKSNTTPDCLVEDGRETLKSLISPLPLSLLLTHQGDPRALLTLRGTKFRCRRFAWRSDSLSLIG